MSIDTSFSNEQTAVSSSQGISPASGNLEDAVLQETITQLTSESVPSESAPSESLPSGSLNVTDAAWLLLPLWFAVVWVALFFVFSEGWKATQQKLGRLQPTSRIPCRNCRFYTNSVYLKCAVRPIDAATERAIACTDYAPKYVKDPDRPSDDGNDVKPD
jgi:hypothetical protein